MALKQEIANAILEAQRELTGDQIPQLRSFTNPPVSVLLIRPKRPNVREGRRSVITVTVDAKAVDTVVKDVEKFCSNPTRGLHVARIEKGSKATIISITLG